MLCFGRQFLHADYYYDSMKKPNDTRRTKCSPVDSMTYATSMLSNIWSNKFPNEPESPLKSITLPEIPIHSIEKNCLTLSLAQQSFMKSKRHKSVLKRIEAAFSSYEEKPITLNGIIEKIENSDECNWPEILQLISERQPNPLSTRSCNSDDIRMPSPIPRDVMDRRIRSKAQASLIVNKLPMRRLSVFERLCAPPIPNGDRLTLQDASKRRNMLAQLHESIWMGVYAMKFIDTCRSRAKEQLNSFLPVQRSIIHIQKVWKVKLKKIQERRREDLMRESRRLTPTEAFGKWIPIIFISKVIGRQRFKDKSTDLVKSIVKSYRVSIIYQGIIGLMRSVRRIQRFYRSICRFRAQVELSLERRWLILEHSSLEQVRRKAIKNICNPALMAPNLLVDRVRSQVYFSRVKEYENMPVHMQKMYKSLIPLQKPPFVVPVDVPAAMLPAPKETRRAAVHLLCRHLRLEANCRLRTLRTQRELDLLVSPVPPFILELLRLERQVDRSPSKSVPLSISAEIERRDAVIMSPFIQKSGPISTKLLANLISVMSPMRQEAVCEQEHLRIEVEEAELHRRKKMALEFGLPPSLIASHSQFEKLLGPPGSSGEEDKENELKYDELSAPTVTISSNHVKQTADITDAAQHNSVYENNTDNSSYKKSQKHLQSFVNTSVKLLSKIEIHPSSSRNAPSPSPSRASTPAQIPVKVNNVASPRPSLQNDEGRVVTPLPSSKSGASRGRKGIFENSLQEATSTNSNSNNNNIININNNNNNNINNNNNNNINNNNNNVNNPKSNKHNVSQFLGQQMLKMESKRRLSTIALYQLPIKNPKKDNGFGGAPPININELNKNISISAQLLFSPSHTPTSSTVQNRKQLPSSSPPPNIIIENTEDLRNNANLSSHTTYQKPADVGVNQTSISAATSIFMPSKDRVQEALRRRLAPSLWDPVVYALMMGAIKNTSNNSNNIRQSSSPMQFPIGNNSRLIANQLINVNSSSSNTSNNIINIPRRHISSSSFIQSPGNSEANEISTSQLNLSSNFNSYFNSSSPMYPNSSPVIAMSEEEFRLQMKLRVNQLETEFTSNTTNNNNERLNAIGNNSSSSSFIPRFTPALFDGAKREPILELVDIEDELIIYIYERNGQVTRGEVSARQRVLEQRRVWDTVLMKSNYFWQCSDSTVSVFLEKSRSAFLEEEAKKLKIQQLEKLQLQQQQQQQQNQHASSSPLSPSTPKPAISLNINGASPIVSPRSERFIEINPPLTATKRKSAESTDMQRNFKQPNSLVSNINSVTTPNEKNIQKKFDFNRGLPSLALTSSSESSSSSNAAVQNPKSPRTYSTVMYVE